MESKGYLTTRVLLNHFHKTSIDSFLKKIPSEEAASLQKQNVQSEEIALLTTPPDELLSKWHYSWLTPGFDRIPPELYSLILSVLPESQIARLSKHLRKQKSNVSLSPAVKNYLLNLFYGRLIDKKSIPIQFLPQTTLTPLAFLDRQDLLEVIDFLGIYDLAPEVRQIVDKQRLTTLYSCLSPKKQQFLRICLTQQDKIQSTKIQLQKWHGSREDLEKILHLRGMARLGKALIGQHPDFIEHLTHMLDTGRGEIILKHTAQKVSPAVVEALIQQVLNVMNFLKKKSLS